MHRDLRLRRRAEFEDVRRRGRRVSDRLLILGTAPVDAPATRCGLAVSKRVGGAVVRNRLKRRLRACLSSLDLEPGYNLVVSARPAAAEAPYARLEESLRALARRAGVLKTKSTEERRRDTNVQPARRADAKRALE